MAESRQELFYYLLYYNEHLHIIVVVCHLLTIYIWYINITYFNIIIIIIKFKKMCFYLKKKYIITSENNFRCLHAYSRGLSESLPLQASSFIQCVSHSVSPVLSFTLVQRQRC